MGVSLEFGVMRMNLDDPAADMTCLGVPGQVIANFEFAGHQLPSVQRTGPARVTPSTVLYARDLKVGDDVVCPVDRMPIVFIQERLLDPVERRPGFIGGSAFDRVSRQLDRDFRI